MPQMTKACEHTRTSHRDCLFRKATKGAQKEAFNAGSSIEKMAAKEVEDGTSIHMYE